MIENYTADCIKILSPEETAARFGWVSAFELAKQYQRDEIWVANGLEACRRCGVEADYFIDRYLKGIQSVPKIDLVSESFRELLKEQQGYGCFTKT